MFSHDDLRSAGPGIAAALTVALFASAAVWDPDVGFHIATGRAVLEGGIPTANVLSFTNAGHPWLAHNWLSGMVAELLWQVGGAPAIWVGRIAIVLATWAFVFGSAKRLGATPMAAWAGVAVACAAAAERFALRPHLFSALFLAWALWLVVRVEEDGPKTARLAAIAAVVAAAFQFHSGAWLVWGGVGLIGVAHVLAGVRDRSFGPGPALIASAMAGLLIAAVAVYVYHPAGVRVLLVPFLIARDPIVLATVPEFRGLFDVPPGVVPHAWTLLVVCLLAALPRPLPWRWIVLVVVFAALSVRHVRFFDSLAIAAAPMVAVAVTGATESRASVRRYLPLVLAMFVALVAVERAGRFAFGPRLDVRFWPTHWFEELDRLGLPERVYVSNEYAGPYLAATYPERKVFFDTRWEAYPPTFVHEAYRHVRWAQPGWDEVLARYHIDVMLLSPTRPDEREAQGGAANIRQRAAEAPNWLLVGFDRHASLWVRRGVLAAEVEGRLKIEGVDPDAVADPDAARAGPPR